MSSFPPDISLFPTIRTAGNDAGNGYEAFDSQGFCEDGFSQQLTDALLSLAAAGLQPSDTRSTPSSREGSLSRRSGSANSEYPSSREDIKLADDASPGDENDRRGGVKLDRKAAFTAVHHTVDGHDVQAGYIEGIIYDETKLQMLLATNRLATSRGDEGTKITVSNDVTTGAFWVSIPWTVEEPWWTTAQLRSESRENQNLGTYGQVVKDKADELLTSGKLWQYVSYESIYRPPHAHYASEVERIVIDRPQEGTGLNKDEHGTLEDAGRSLSGRSSSQLESVD